MSMKLDADCDCHGICNKDMYNSIRKEYKIRMQCMWNVVHFC